MTRIGGGFPLPWRVDPVGMPDGRTLAYIVAANDRSVVDLDAIPVEAAEAIVAAVNDLAGVSLAAGRVAGGRDDG